MDFESGIVEGAEKIVIYGPEGIGKSTFASRFPNPRFIDTEGSTKKLDVTRTKRPTSWTMLMEQVKYFVANPLICDTLVIDTADWAEQLCAAELCARSHKDGIEGFGYGKGYKYLAEDFGKLLNLLEELIAKGTNVTIVAHAMMRKFEQPDEMGQYDRWELKLTKYVAPMVREWADHVFFVNYKTYVIDADGQGTQKGTNKVQGGKRVMYTSHHPCWDAKTRWTLQPEVNFDYDEIGPLIYTRDKIVSPVQTITVPDPPKQIETQPQTVEQAFDQMVNPTPKPQNTPGMLVDWSDVIKESKPNIPKALADLMDPEQVTMEEIQKAVASKGYYPIDTPFENYDPGFVEGVLIGAWPQVFNMIQQSRANGDEVPF